MTVTLSTICRDFAAEADQLDDIVSDEADSVWSTPTASPGWTVADQIAHLTYFDFAAATAISDPERFGELKIALFEAAGHGQRGVDDLTLGEYRAMRPRELLKSWREGREKLSATAARLAEATRVDWYGPAMGSKSFLTARLMETWAHGQDVVDALGSDRQPTDRVVHVARLGFITREWSYLNRAMAVPEHPVLVSLVAPSGTEHNFGEFDAESRIAGSAVDFALVTTQRRAVEDTQLEVIGEPASEWMKIAQAFAGPPTDGPQPAK